MTAWPFGGAVISDCQKMRYHLWRQRAEVEPMRRLLICMLNPSTASADDDDPTIRKCCGFAERLEFERFDVANLFPWRTAYPKELYQAQLSGNDIVCAAENHAWLERLTKRATLTVVAWGANAQTWRPYARTVTKLLTQHSRNGLMCWGITKEGHPNHPLMLSYTTELEPFTYTDKPSRRDVE